MKRFFSIFSLFIAIFCVFLCKPNVFKNQTKATSSTPKMAIVIDDFGSFDQSGVTTLLTSNVPLTCAVIPNVDFSEQNINDVLKANKELILHMPMQSHVNLPEDWYGPVYIKNTDSPETAIQKIETCLKDFPEIKGFNIHIGSGVSQNKTLMTAIYDFAKQNNLYFLDSRTIETHATEDACKNTNSIYLGRDVFLEPNNNRSYAGVKARLAEGASLALEKGYAIVIGHVGAEGGENTARAIVESAKNIESMGVKLVTLSEIFEDLK